MRARGFSVGLLVAAITVGAVGCTASAPTEPAPPKFSKSMNEVRDDAASMVESLTGAFTSAMPVAESDAEVHACPGEAEDIGSWIWATSFSADDVAATIADVQERYADSISSTGSLAQDIEYADGTPYRVGAPHTLIEDETGSYLLTYPLSPSGIVTIRTITACGVLQ